MFVGSCFDHITIGNHVDCDSGGLVNGFHKWKFVRASVYQGAVVSGFVGVDCIFAHCGVQGSCKFCQSAWFRKVLVSSYLFDIIRELLECCVQNPINVITHFNVCGLFHSDMPFS